MAEPFISVVVPVLDMAGTIGACLDALVAQSLPRTAYEVIVVDNGSTDGTREIAARYAVTCLDEPTRGAPSARNRGIRAASGTYVAFTDADCVASRTWLARLVAAARTHDADAIAGGLVVLDPESSLLARYSARIGQYDPDVSLHHPRYPYAVTGNVAIRRALLTAAGGFDSAFTTYDAAELFWRLSQRTTLKTTVEPRAIVFYRTRDTVSALARQNFDYGLGYARFCRHVDDADDVSRPSRVLHRWSQRVRSGFAAFVPSGDTRPRDAWRLRLIHVVRETALAAGTIAGHRRFASPGRS